MSDEDPTYSNSDDLDRHWFSRDADIKPLHSDRVVFNKATPLRPRQNNEPQDTSDPLWCASHPDELIPGDAVFDYFDPSLSHMQKRRFKNGKIPIQATIDLHHMTAAQAVPVLQEAIAKCQDRHGKVLNIIHGKHNTSPVATLKSHVKQILQNHPAVLAFISAPNHLGGTGATLCLLRSNSQNHPNNPKQDKVPREENKKDQPS